MKRNHELILEARQVIANSVGTALPAPEEMIGSMAAVSLRDGVGPEPGSDLSPLMSELMDEGFVTLVMNWPGWPNQLLRVSGCLYNTVDEYSALADVLGARDDSQDRRSDR